MSLAGTSTDAKAAARSPSSAPPPPLKLAALLEALPFVPKPVVQLMAEYTRPPPAELIRTLTSAIDRKALREGIELHPFSSGAQLLALLNDKFDFEPPLPAFTFVIAAQAISERSVDRLDFGGRRALEALLAEDADALCVMELKEVTLGTTLFLAVPDGFTPAAGPQHWPLIGVAGNAADVKSITSLTGAESPVCGLFVFNKFWLFE